MSQRTHLWLRVAALVVIAAAAWVPRSSVANGSSASASGGHGRATAASVQAVSATEAAFEANVSASSR